MKKTNTEVIQVSSREVQVILRASARTSRTNWGSEVFFLGASGVAVFGATTGALAAGFGGGA